MTERQYKKLMECIAKYRSLSWREKVEFKYGKEYYERLRIEFQTMPQNDVDAQIDMMNKRFISDITGRY